MTHQFSLSLRENVVQIGNLHLVITEVLIAKATKLPQKGERWFKKREINRAKWKHFLFPLLENFYYKHGYPMKFLKPQWSHILQLIIRYITCNGRFSCVHFYHLKILMVFEDFRVNLP